MPHSRDLTTWHRRGVCLYIQEEVGIVMTVVVYHFLSMDLGHHLFLPSCVELILSAARLRLWATF